jgi:predicted DNA-binding transcriptional regulator YafY
MFREASVRASRLLRLLLLLQNRGRQTSAQLAAELEVAQRTVLRDLDALTEAGLPVVIHRGVKGGVELGFNYRTRLTGLSASEAEALGVILASAPAGLAALGLGTAARSARSKLLESLPDGVRETAMLAQRRFRFQATREPEEDPRVSALAQAIRAGRRVRIRARSGAPRTIHPAALVLGKKGWAVIDEQQPDSPIPLEECDDLNVSALSFRAS